MQKSKQTVRIVILLTLLTLLNQTNISHGHFAQNAQSPFEHNDVYWAELAKNEPAYVVDQSQLLVPAMDELDELGEWSDVIEWPHIPVSGANLPDGRLITWASSQTTSFPEDEPEFTYSSIWDPINETFIDANNSTHNMFCAHNVILEDGTVFANGGRDTTEYVSTFDYQIGTWTQIESMNQKRWYPTTVALPSGQVFTALGDGATEHPEIWTPGSGWSEMSGVDLGHVLVSEHDLSMEWPFLAVAPDNSIFHAGPTPEMHSISLVDNGALTHMGTLPDASWYPKDGTYVMFEEGKMLVVGGRDANSSIASTNKAMVIDINGPDPVLTTTNSMTHKRSHHSAVMMPNGEVFIVGGSGLIKKFSDAGSKLTPEIWNPDTGEWREVASMATPRNYHSIAIMLTDGRILVGGGGLSEDQLNVNHPDVEIYSPPYLFDSDGNLATRPVINTAPATVGYGETFSVTTSTDISQFSLIKLSSITHQMNTDLRFLEPEFNEVTSGEYNVTTHGNPSVLTPGYYMLFALDNNGVPSEAHILQVNTNNAPEVTHLGNLSNTQGEMIELTIPATDPLSGSLTFSADNLPPGLSINSVTGEISGSIAFDDADTYKVTVTISNGMNAVDVVFYWEINYLLSETGRIIANQGTSDSWHEVAFYYTYDDPVVVLGPVTQNDTEPLTVRVQNVTSNGFEFQLDEWDYLDGSHSSELVYYWVVEAGSYELDDGSLLTAVATTSVSDSTTVHNFPITFNKTPTVFAQAMTTNDTSAVTTQISGVSTTQLSLALVEEEANDGTHAAEQVHLIAIEPTVVANHLEVGEITTGAEADWTSHTFAQTYSDTPVFIASEQTVNSNDPAYLRMRSLSPTSVEIFVEEEASNDAELVPTSESVGYLVVDLDHSNNPLSPNALPPNSAPVFVGTAVDQSSTEGEWLSYSLPATDSNGGHITYSAEGLPPDVTINPITGEISGSVVAGDAGSYTVTVYADDNIFSTEQSFSWIIEPAEGGWHDWADETNDLLDLNVTDSYEKDLAIGDLDQDGWDDIVIVRKNAFDAVGGQSDILLMNINGVLEDKTSEFAPEFLINQTDARDVVIADLDGDGWLDVIIASTFDDPPVLYRNQGNNAFGQWRGLLDESTRLPATYDTSTVQFCAVTVGDINGDDAPDIYFANYDFEGGAQDVLLINDGFGHFNEESESRLGDLRNSAFGTAVQIIDMNGDLKNDIVKLSAEYAIEPFNKAGIFTLINDGDGTFTTFEEIPSTDAYMFMVAHLNEDNALDVFVQEDVQDLVNLGSTDSGFSSQMLSSARTISHGGNFQFADVDRDGDLDLGLADVDTMFPPCDTGPDSLRKFVVLNNDGNGNFSDPHGAAPEVWNQNMFDFAFIDINRDGNLDIFAAECEGYAVYMNTAVPTINQPPIITDLAEHNGDEGDTLSIDITANDADGDTLIMTVIGLPDSLSFNSATKKITGSLTPADAGLYVITISATDGELTDVSIFVLSVGDVNQTPIIVNPGNFTSYEEDIINIEIVASDYEEDPLTYTITGLPASLSYNSSSGVISGTVGTADIDIYTITVVVSDGETQSQISFDWIVEAKIFTIYLPIVLK